MGGSLLFPSVRIRELDFSEYAPQLATTVLGLVGVAERGPLHEPTLITTEAELIATFGAPPDLSLGASERQRVIIGDTSGGTFTLSLDGDASGVIDPTSDDGAAIKTILTTGITALTTDNISVTGSAGGPHIITFADDLANRAISTLVAGGANTSVTVEVLTEGSTAPSDYAMHAAFHYLRQGRQLYFTRTCQTVSGTWQASYAWTPDAGATGAIVYNAAASPDDVLRCRAFTHGEWGNDLQLRFIKTSGAQNEIQTLTFTAAEDESDTFKLTFDGQTTADILYTETVATMATRIKSALELLSNIDTVNVTYIPSTGTATASVVFHIEFTGTTVKFTDQPIMTSAVGSGTPVTTAPTIGNYQTGKAIETNVYRLEVLGHVDNTGNTGILEVFERVMLANDAALLASENAYFLGSAVNDGIRNVVNASSLIYFDPTEFPDTGYDIDTEIDDGTDDAGTTFDFFGGFAALDASAGTSDDLSAAYVGTQVDDTYGPTALQTFANPETLDVNLLAIPGVTDEAALTELVAICETRQDAMAILDTPEGLTYTGAIAWHNKTDAYATTGYAPNSSYAALFWPWVKSYDPYNSQEVTLPPSCFAPGQFAFNDLVAAPWFAAAGLVRGRVNTALGLESSTPDIAALETMYSGGNVINVVRNLAKEGVHFWGNRTTQRRATALDRVNVRRMLLYVEKVIASVVRVLVFEPSDPQTWRRFTNLVDPILRGVQRSRGLYDYRIICDETTNPTDVTDKNQMRGVLLLKPTKTAEFITVDFTLLSTGAEFSIPQSF